MARGSHSENARKHNKGPRTAAMFIMAVIFTAIGVLIAPNFRTSSPPGSGTDQGVVQADVYPLVQQDGEYVSPFVSVVEKVQDAVVNVSARSHTERVAWWQRQGVQTSSGSGFFFRDDGYILTNNHVVEGAEELWVHTSSGYIYEAKLVGGDPQTDLAVIKVEPEEEIHTIPFGNSDDVKVGEWAIAIGNPFPQQGLDRSVTVGVISAMGRSNLQFGRETPDYQSYIQTDASINPGNSGGPLLNLKGECIGVNAAISSPTGASVGIGFAIPINLARAIVPDLITSGRAHRGWLGIWFHEVTQREAKRQNMDRVIGVTVDSVFSGSPAEQAGIQTGDIVVKFNDQPVDNAGRLSVLVSTSKGASVPVEVVRDGETLDLTVDIVDRDQFLSSLPEEALADNDEARIWLGMEITTATRQLARATGNDFVEGVYVLRVYPNSAADLASITRGSVIIQIGDQPVQSVEELQSVVENMGRVSRVSLIVLEPSGSLTRKEVRL